MSKKDRIFSTYLSLITFAFCSALLLTPFLPSFPSVSYPILPPDDITIRTKMDEIGERLLEQIQLARIYQAACHSDGNISLASDFSLTIQRAQQILSHPHSRRYFEKTMPEGNSLIHKFKELFATAIASHISSAGYIAHLEESLKSQEEKAYEAQRESVSLGQLAAESIPKTLQCITVKLTQEWGNFHNYKGEFKKQLKENTSMEESSRMHHYCLVSDNVLAVSVVISSAVANSANQSQMIFHIITDSVAYHAMQMWFILNPPGTATVEVLSLESFLWLRESSIPALRQLSDPNLKQFYHSISEHEPKNTIKFHNPKYLSILNHLRFYLPQIFPNLKKILFLDDDVVVQKDLSPLFDVDLKGNANGAVETCGKIFHRFHKYLNFSHPLLRHKIDPEDCGWAYGMNVFDLEVWRKHNLTERYHYWQEQNFDRSLWQLGTLPAGLLTFYGFTFPLKRSWHVLGLGYDSHVDLKLIEEGAVIHWNGNKKPWLKITNEKYRWLWTRFVDFNNSIVKDCKFT